MAKKKMWSSRRLNMLKILATGKTVTFEEFRDQVLAPDDIPQARRTFQWVAGRGAQELGCQIESKRDGRRVVTIRLLNVDEIVQKLQNQSRQGSSGASKKTVSTPVTA